MTWGPKTQRRVTVRRIVWFQAVISAAFLLLLLAFWKIQVADNEQYRQLAEQNRIKALPIPAARGNIVDRYGRALARSRIAMSAVIDRESAEPENLGRIAARLGLDPDLLAERLSDASAYSKSRHFVLKEDLSVAEIAFLQAHRSEFQEIDLVKGMSRQYPESGVAVHAMGYVAEVSKSELNLREFLLNDFGDEIGKSGIERQYNRWLSGEDGRQRFLVNSLGRQLETLSLVDATPGENLRLTIDLDLQAVSELGLEGRKGAVVALDPRNGEILAMASSPVYDPNKFVTGFSSSEWATLNSDPSNPMLNRSIQGTWAMGSVFKPIVGLAGLEAGLAGPDFKVHCPGGLQFGGRYFRCHKRGGHGTVSLRKAIAQSCDVYFYQLGHKLGIDRLAAYARIAGLGDKTNVDLPDEVPGLVPTERWKIRRMLQPWNPGETIIVAIGQGAMSVTPIQAAHAIGGLAVGGVWHRPHMVSRRELAAVAPGSELPSPRISPVAREHMDVLHEAMWSVVNGGGTGGQARLKALEVCGKTGTSQRVSNATRLKANREDFEDDAWFVGYAPCRSPEVVVAVLLENGKHSYYAAAVARDVIQVWMLNRAEDLLTDTEGTLARSQGGQG